MKIFTLLPSSLTALFATALLGACAAAVAQIQPDSPIINFRLPMFGDDGNQVWDLQGKEGYVVNEEEVDLTGMHLLIFAKDQPGRVETEIISPAATLFVQKEQVRGQDSITVRGDNYVITGRHWLWDADTDRVVIDEDVKITFHEELSNLLDVQ